MSDVLKRVLCLVLALVVVFSFAGCRKSPVLEQKVYTQDAETDPEQQELDNQEDHTEEDTTLPPRTTKPDVSQQADQTKVSAKKPRTSPQTRQNTNQDGQNTNTPSPSPANNQSNTNKGTGEIPGVNEDPNSPVPAVDPNSQNKPEPTDEVATVAAVGEAALYVEMLGGPNRLVASSASFTQNAAASRFEDHSKVAELWPDEGEQAMDSGAFDELLSIHPEAVFFVSENASDNSQGRLWSFTADQITRLQAAGIKTIPLSRFNTTHNIQNNVRTIGEVLGNGSKVPGAKNAKDMADKYIRWMNGIIQGRESQTFSGVRQINMDQDGVFSDGYAETNDHYRTDGQYTILINGWASDAVSDFDPSGSAYAISGYTQRSSPVSYYLSLGGLANTAVLQPDLRTRNLPVIPMYQAKVNGSINGDKLYASEYQNHNIRMTNPETGIYIGTPSRFRTIIVDSDGTRANLHNSPVWDNHGYNTNPISGASDYGRINGDAIELTNIHDTYNVVVNPRGIGSWTTGSPESPLEVLWAEQLVALSSETNENQLQDLAFERIQNEITYFYTEFYGVQPDLNAIKNGA